MAKINNLLHWFYKLSWKKLGAVGGLALTLAALPLIRQAATNPTRTRSEAALLPKPEPISKEFVTPEGPPQIFLVDHFFGKVGDAVLVHGEHLGGLHPNSYVSLSGEKITEENLVSWTSDYIEFKVPDGAKSGQVSVSILDQRTSWDGIFFVINDQTEAELRLVGNNNQAQLMAQNIVSGQELLVWILVIKGEGELTITNNQSQPVVSTELDSPIGKVYQVEVPLSSSLTSQSATKLVSILNVGKNEGQLIGLARAEVATTTGEIIPIKIHPLYVSF